MTLPTMRAYVRDRYGDPAVLELRDVPRPEVAPDSALVRVRAVSVNPVDWYGVAGMPLPARVTSGLRRPKATAVGVDFAGVVEAVGAEFTGAAVGDEVYGGRTGAFAEYVAVKDAVVPKPANASFEEAAGVPIAALTALQGLRDHGEVGSGTKVLINGASGGVGTFAVQIAKSLGAHVTAVCSTRNAELARELGAERVVDYTREDFTRSGERHDVLLDVAGSRRFRDYARVLTPGAKVVVAGVGAPKRGVLGPLRHIVRMRVGALRASQSCTFFVAKLTRDDLDALRGLIEAGRVRPVLDRTYGFEELPQALSYLAEGHARGKVVVRM